MSHSCIEEVIALALWDRDTHVHTHTRHTHTSTSHASRRAIRKSSLPKIYIYFFYVGFWMVILSSCTIRVSQYLYYKTFSGNTMLFWICTVSWQYPKLGTKCVMIEGLTIERPIEQALILIFKNIQYVTLNVHGGCGPGNTMVYKYDYHLVK